MSLSLALDDGATLAPVAFSKDVLRVVSPRAFAPGAPVTLEAHFGEAERTSLEGRVASVRRRPDGAYDLSLRMVNLRRAHRQALGAIS